MKNKNNCVYNSMEHGVGKGELLTISGKPAALQTRKTQSPRNKRNGNIYSPRNITTTPRPTAGPKINNTSRKLILHFDVRNTILVADSVTEIGVEQALNSYLTGVTWGFENDSGKWEWVSDVPSLTAPKPNTITYYKYLEKQLVRTPTDRGKLREETGDFTQEPLGAGYIQYFEKALKAFEWQHSTQDDILTMRGKNGKLYHYILPSVFQLIQHLHDTNRDFAIVIRTYGMDAPNVLKAISHSLQGNHVNFPNLPSHIQVNHNPGYIKRHSDGTISVEIEHAGKKHFFKDETEMYKFLSTQNGVCAFIDDFIFWQENSYSSSCAKPLWVDLTDTSVQHIFFDDNIRLTDSDSIVDLRLANQSTDESSKFTSVTLKNTEKYENMCLVHADLLHSTSDIDYYIDKVKLCEKNYTKFLNTKV